MATATETPQGRNSSDQRFVIHDVGWQGYETLLTLVSDRPIRITYDRGTLELMSPSQKHERDKSLFGRFIETMTEELDIPCSTFGSTTWKREALDRGLESDECFYLYRHAEQVSEKTVDLSVDPPPDLAIEVETSKSALDRPQIYAALGVPELWRFDGQVLRIFVLRDDATYVASASSRHFPFLPVDDMVRLVLKATSMVHTRWGRMIREWIRTELAPRYQGPPEGML